MIKKIIFLVLFTPVHALATLLMVQWFFFNPSRDPGVMETICKIMTFIFTLPVIYPCLRIDPDGEWFPKSLQIFLPFFNSFIWALLILFLFNIVGRLHRKKGNAKGSHPLPIE